MALGQSNAGTLPLEAVGVPAACPMARPERVPHGHGMTRACDDLGPNRDEGGRVNLTNSGRHSQDEDALSVRTRRGPGAG
jgi:hypothetical protein